MTETVLTPEMTDEQYEAEADRLLAEMRQMREESKRLDESIAATRANSQQTMQEIREILQRLQTR